MRLDIIQTLILSHEKSKVILVPRSGLYFTHSKTVQNITAISALYDKKYFCFTKEKSVINEDASTSENCSKQLPG